MTRDFPKVPAYGDVYTSDELENIKWGRPVRKHDPLTGRTLSNYATNGLGLVLSARGPGFGWELRRLDVSDFNTKARELLAMPKNEREWS